MHHGRSGKADPHIQLSKRSVKRINARLTELTTRNLTSITLPIMVKRLNQSLRGWWCYFDYACLRTHLRKHHKVKVRRIGQVSESSAI